MTSTEALDKAPFGESLERHDTGIAQWDQWTKPCGRSMSTGQPVAVAYN